MNLDEASSLRAGRRPNVDEVLRGLRAQLDGGRFTHIGYPVATDIDFTPLRPLAGELWNNIGSPCTDSAGGNHSKPAERALLAWAGELLGFPEDDRWGYVTTGGTEGNRAGLAAARGSFPLTREGTTTALAYYSRAAHYSVRKALAELAIPAVAVDARDGGELDCAHLDRLLARHGDRPAIVVATAGTTMTEAVDDSTRIVELLDTYGIARRHLHLDAALSGIPLALDGALPLGQADSIAVSGYKFLGAKRVCGLVLGRHRVRYHAPRIAYTATRDGTLSGSRDGIPALMMWYVVATHGADGLRARSHAARRLAERATALINAAGWPAWRHPHAFTVVFPTPPPEVTARWTLANDTDGRSHIVCMPGVTDAQVSAFAADLARTRLAISPMALPIATAATRANNGVTCR
jgi:histidine decarboxylase